MGRDYYEILCVSRTANLSEIKQAYRKQALKWHPDRNKDNTEEANCRFQEIANAYSILVDSDKRRLYDQFGETNVNKTANTPTPASTSTSSPFSSNTRHYSRPFFGFGNTSTNTGGWEYVFSQFANGFGNSAQSPFSRSTREDRHYYGYDYNFKTSTSTNRRTDASVNEKTDHNTEKASTHTNARADNKTSGSGTNTNTNTNDDANINAHMHTGTDANTDAGGKTRSTSYNRNDGQRRITKRSLPLTLEDLYNGGLKEFKMLKRTRRGSIIEKKLPIKVQPGWKAGTKVIFVGEGHESSDGQVNDLELTVEQRSHDLFTREGDNLLTDVNLTLKEALTGFTKEIKTLDGDGLVLTSSAGVIQPGQRMRFNRRGMPNPRRGRPGDLLVTYNVTLPTDLTEEQLQVIKFALK